MKKHLFIWAAVTVAVIVALYFVLGIDSYHKTTPELVMQTAYKADELKIPKNAMLYGESQCRSFFEKHAIKPRYTNRFFETRPMIPLICKGKKIKRLSSGWFSTDEVTFEFSPADPEVLYCYYIDERYNNFMAGLVL